MDRWLPTSQREKQLVIVGPDASVKTTYEVFLSKQ